MPKLGGHFGGGGFGNIGGSGSGGNFRGGGFHVGPLGFRGGLFCLFLGGNRYEVPKKYSLITGFLTFLFIVSLIMFISMLGYVSETREAIDEKIANRLYYIELITNAESNSKYKISAKVSQKACDSTSKKWYITYSYNGDNLGESYCVYSGEQIKEFAIGEEIDVAVSVNAETEAVNSSVFSVPFDYKDMPLEQDGEYVYYNSQLKTQLVEQWVSLGVCILSLAGLILVLTRAKKIEGEEVKDEDDDDDEDEKPTKLVTRCEYCGSVNENDAVVCKNCGSKKLVTKKVKIEEEK